MLQRSNQLPEWVDAIEDVPAGRAPDPSGQTAKILREAQENRAKQDRILCQNVKSWRDFNERRGSPAWPHKPLSDEDIELKIEKSVSRQRPLTCKIMNASAVPNTRRDGSFTGRAGWPVHQQGGTERLQGEVSPADEYNSAGHHTWVNPLHRDSPEQYKSPCQAKPQTQVF